MRRRDLIDVPVLGVIAGVAAIGCVLLIELVQWFAFGSDHHSLAVAVETAPTWRKILAPAAIGVLTGLGWWALRRQGPLTSLEAAARGPRNDSGPTIARLGLWRPIADAALQTTIVGGGGSVGREAAPRLVAGALAERWGQRTGMARTDLPVAIAAAGGAGLAAVYDVPVAGVVFTCEVVALAWRPGLVLRAAVASALGTAFAWPVVPGHPALAPPPLPGAPAAMAAAALVAIPLTLVLGRALRALADRARAAAPAPGARLAAYLGVAGLLLGVVTIWLPAVPGNGKGIVDWALAGRGTLALFAAMLVAKPLLTALYFRAGAVGGLLMPSLGTGAAAGAALALALAPDQLALWAMLGAVGVLAVTQRGPLFAGFFGWELTHCSATVALALLAVSLGARGGDVLLERRARVSR